MTACSIRSARRSSGSYVLTTGTGSGKSLAYIVPIIDRVLRAGPGRGVRALIVYPMNALANSQFGELEKFVRFGYPPGTEPIRYDRYTGQESDEEREAILDDPPDIILTNYVMLELMLTRQRERKRLIEVARGALRQLFVAMTRARDALWGGWVSEPADLLPQPARTSSDV